MSNGKRIAELEAMLYEALVELEKVKDELVALNQRTCKHEWGISGMFDSCRIPSSLLMHSDGGCLYKKTCTKCGKFEYIGENAFHELKRLEAQKIVDECNKKLV